MDQLEKEKQNKLFSDPKKRGRWFDHIYGTPLMTCPNFAIDSRTDLKTFEPSQVKRIYIEEGASFLKNKIDLPPPFDEKREQPYLLQTQTFVLTQPP